MVIDGRVIMDCFPHLIFTKQRTQLFPFEAQESEAGGIPAEMPGDGED